jgi:hypothetical protein
MNSLLKAILLCGTLGVLLLAVASIYAQPEGWERPEYAVPRTTAKITVDGRLDEEVWKAAPLAEFFKSRDGSPGELETEARLLYDDEFLYFGFSLRDANIWATFKKRDEHLWTEEVVEVFIQADPSHPSYIELEVNPLGTMIDIFLIDIRKPIPYQTWNSHRLEWGVQVNGTVDGQPGDQGWTCEMALPMEEVITAPNNPPQPGDRWRMNLYRVERKPDRVSLAWSPILKGDFHTPAMFGDLVFTEKTVP